MTNEEKIRRLYDLGQHGPTGFSAAAVAQLEERLHITLPAALKTYYLTLGMHEQLNFAHNRLLKPADEVAFSDDRYLLLFEENQRVAYWGIRETDLGLADPPVWGNYGTADAPHWTPETNTTGDFFLLMAVYNGTFGGLRYNANAMDAVEAGVVSQIEKNWKLVPEISWERQKVYTDNFYEVLSLSFDDRKNCTGIFIGTSDAERFDAMLDKLDIDWSYISYEDEDAAEDEDEAE